MNPWLCVLYVIGLVNNSSRKECDINVVSSSQRPCVTAADVTATEQQYTGELELSEPYKK